MEDSPEHKTVCSVTPDRVTIFESPISELATLESIYLKVVEAYPDATIAIDRKGVIVVFNASAELMFDYAREDVLGKQIEILIPESLRERHVAHRNEYFQEPRVREMGMVNQILEGVRRDGSIFEIQIKLAPVVVPTSGVFFLAVVRRVKRNQPLRESPK